MAISSGALRRVELEGALVGENGGRGSSTEGNKAFGDGSVGVAAGSGGDGGDKGVLTISIPVVGTAGIEVTPRPRKKPVVAAVAICAMMPDNTVAVAASATWMMAMTTSELAFTISVISAACTLQPATDARSAL